jgi:hypothetical protein
MPLNAPPVAPTPVAVQETPAEATPVSQAPPVTPQVINLSAQQMSPTVFVGFKLAKLMLLITSGSILLFVLYLFCMEWMIGSDVRGAYQKALNPDRVGAELLTVTEFEKWSADLGSARKNPASTWTTEALQNAQNTIKLINELPSVSEDKKARLKDCVPPPPASDTSRDSKIDSCIEILGGLRQAALAAVAATTDAKVAADSAGKIGEQRQSLHTFWVQAAQLVLLNLLLPLLTALFGYIFGTQQAPKNSQMN